MHGIKADNIGNRMLSKMGWEEGKGLGHQRGAHTSADRRMKDPSLSPSNSQQSTQHARTNAKHQRQETENTTMSPLDRIRPAKQYTGRQYMLQAPKPTPKPPTIGIILSRQTELLLHGQSREDNHMALPRVCRGRTSTWAR